MAPVALVITIFATYFCFANGPCRVIYWLQNDYDTITNPEFEDNILRQDNVETEDQESCSTPDGGAGTCKSLYECQPLFEIVKKPSKTQSDIDVLTKSKCGFEGTAPKVCCPNPCYTPEGKTGSCVSIYSCPSLASLLTPPVSRENMQYVQNSKTSSPQCIFNNNRCTGKDPYSVCCDPGRDVGTNVPTGNCAATATAFPPDPATECCGVDGRVGNKINGGNATTVDQYPWLVIIEYIKNSKIKLLCGGVLISSRYVMTAAHCVAGDVLQIGTPKNVRLGEYNTQNDGPDCIPVEAGGEDCTDGMIIVPIEKTIPHPDYNIYRKQSPNDIALIRLQQPAPFTDFIRPICLPSSDVTISPPSNFSLFAAGWGAVSTTQPSSDVKLHVDLPFVQKNVCEPAYKSGGRNLKLTSGQICAGGIAGKDSCKGDSGGPLMYENGRTWEVLGIVSFGPTPCGLPNVPGVYTKVYEYNSWVRRVMVA